MRRGLGGTSGNGRQYVSWVHHEDFTRAVRWLIEHDSIAGPVNILVGFGSPSVAERMSAVMVNLAGGMTVGPQSPRLLAGTGCIGCGGWRYYHKNDQPRNNYTWTSCS